MTLDAKTRKSRPERIRFRLWDDDTTGATPLDLPERKMWPVSLIFAVMFAIFAAVGYSTFLKMWGHSVAGVFDLMFVLFEGFWLLGWSVGVASLGALTVLFLFYSESARLQNGRLVHVPQLGPLKIIIDYDLARVRNVRLENAGSEDKVRIRFDYREGSDGIGDSMSRADAEGLVARIRRAAAAAGSIMETTATAPLQEIPRAGLPEATRHPEPAPPSPMSPSGGALIVANLIPLAGVLLFGWDLASVMVLFWAESAVIGFYTMLKMAIVGKVAAIFGVPFFVGHFGGFMALHFGFIYALFVRGFDATGPDPGLRQGLSAIFGPVWVSLVALFISHGVSFFANFLGRREYATATMKALMSAPYNRIIAMQLALIFGGWIIMALRDPRPALALLVLIKTAVDFAAHRKEHK
jgi:hypothetical protein